MDNSRYGVSPSLDAFLAAILREHNFNPDEPRDEKGRWTTGGSHDGRPNASTHGVPTPSPANRAEDAARRSQAEGKQRATDWLEGGGANGVNRMSASQFYHAWKAGKLPPVVVFGPDARMTKEVRADVALDKARKILSARIIGDYVGHGGAMGKWPAQTLKHLPLGGAQDYGTVGTLYKDFSDIFNNNTPGYVGSFTVSALPQDVRVSYSQGMETVTAVVCFEAYNVIHTLSRNKYFTAGDERAATNVWSNELKPFAPQSNVEMYFRWTEVMHYSRVIGTDKETVWFEVCDKPFTLPRAPRETVGRQRNYVSYITPPVGFSNGSRADYRKIGVELP